MSRPNPWSLSLTEKLSRTNASVRSATSAGSTRLARLAGYARAVGAPTDEPIELRIRGCAVKLREAAAQPCGVDALVQARPQHPASVPASDLGSNLRALVHVLRQCVAEHGPVEALLAVRSR